MFLTEKKLEKKLEQVIRKELGIKDGEDNKINVLNEKILSLKEELEDLKLKKKMEEKEIEHLVKMKEDKLEIDKTKQNLELEKKYQEKEMLLMKEFHSKTLDLLNRKADEFSKLYKEIIDRLPNVNMEIKRGR